MNLAKLAAKIEQITSLKTLFGFVAIEDYAEKNSLVNECCYLRWNGLKTLPLESGEVLWSDTLTLYIKQDLPKAYETLKGLLDKCPVRLQDVEVTIGSAFPVVSNLNYIQIELEDNNE